MNENEKSCGKSLDEHIMSLLLALEASGMSGSCIETYQALLEMAQYVQSACAWKVYEPTNRIAYKLAILEQEQKLNPANAS